jgi:hypothetical protein
VCPTSRQYALVQCTSWFFQIAVWTNLIFLGFGGLFKMKTSFRVEDRLEGATKFKSWKTNILLILEENDLLDYINQDIPDPEEDEEKVKHMKKEIMNKRILVDFVRENLIPHIAELKTTKEMYKALVKLFERKNINRKLDLRNQL